MRVKIVSDGTVNGTQVVNVDTGEPIDRVTEVEWRISVTGSTPLATAVIYIANVPVEIFGVVDERQKQL